MHLMLPLAQVGSLKVDLLAKLEKTSLIGPPVHGRQKVRPITLQVSTDNENAEFSFCSTSLLPKQARNTEAVPDIKITIICFSVTSSKG